MTRLWWLAAFFTVALVRSMTDGIGLVDESWFLQVVARVRAGDVLYRDLFFGATPLSVWLTAAITLLTGVDVLAVKIVTNAAFAATALFTWMTGLRAGLAPRVSAAVAALVLIFGRPYTSPPYTPLAMTAFMATLALVLSDSARTQAACGRSWRVRAAGLAAGLAFLTKPNVGLLAGAAAAVTLATGQGITATERARRMADFAIPALLVVLTGLGGVWASGGLPMLLDYVFLNKAAYVEHGAVPYTATIEQWLASAAAPWSAAALNELARGTILLLPLAVAILAAVRWKRIATDSRLAALLVFAAAATMVAYPRWNRYHLSYALPCLAMALAALGQQPGALANRRWPATGRIAAGALPAALCLVLIPAVAAIAHGARASALPHFSGALLSPAERARLAEAASRFTLAARSRPVFIVSPRAGFLYLASDVLNPTPYDFPAATSVGREGRARLLAAIAGGRLPVVCVGHDRRGLYYFGEVATAIETQLSPGPDVGLCRMYEQP